MSSKTTWILLLLVAAGALYLLVLEDLLGIGTTEERGRKQRMLFEIRPDSVTAITIRRGADEFVFERVDDGWDLTRPVRALADSAAIDGVLGQILALAAAPQPQPADDLLRYGLLEPAIILILEHGAGTATGAGASADDAPGSNSVRVAIGDSTPLGGRRYIRIDDGDIHVVDEAIFGLLDRERLDWRDVAVFTLDPFDAERLEIVRDDAHVVATRDGRRFRFGDPVIDLADSQRIRSLLYKLSGLDAVGFLPAGERTLEALGLDRPALVLSVTYPEESTAESLRVGDTATEHPAARYAIADRFPGEILLVPEDLLIDFAGDADSYRAKELVDLLNLTVTSMRFEPAADGNGPEPIALESTRRGWSIVEPIVIEAQSEVVDALLAALGAVKIRRYVADHAEEAATPFRPVRKILIETDAGPRSFLVGDTDPEGRFLLVSRDERGPILAVDVEVLDLLPTTTRDLRTREVARIDLWEPLTLTLKRPDRTYVVRSENLSFELVEPFAGSLDGRVVQALESTMSPLGAERIVEENAADLSRYGLETPTMTLEAAIRPTTKPAYSVSIRFGNRDENGSTFALVEGTRLVFTVSEESMAPLKSEWLERRLVDAGPADVSRLRVSGKGRDLHLLRRAGDWVAREPADARLDDDAIDKAVSTLAQLSVDRYLTDADDPAATGLGSADELLIRFEVERDARVEEFRLAIGTRGADGTAHARVRGDLLAVLDAATTAALLAPLVEQP